jgi:hypothetical protein
MPVTIHEVAVSRGIKPNELGGFDAGQYYEASLPFFAGCESCGASLAPYNSYPSKSGFIRCKDCIDGLGFDSTLQFESWCQEQDTHQTEEEHDGDDE